MKWQVKMCCALILAQASPHLVRAEALKEPVLEGKHLEAEYYGDAVNVSMLADLLNDADPLVRERATHDLGQTHNLDALPHLSRAMKDTDPSVRSAAAAAAAELPSGRGAGLVIAALDSPDQSVVLAALRSVRSMKLTAARPSLQTLLTRDDSLIQATSLHTLTALQLAAPRQHLRELLQSRSPILRLRAAQNALACDDASDLADELLALAKDGTPAVRGVALAALGKHDLEKVKPLLDQASRSDAALVRRGAVLALAHAGADDEIHGFLDDPSAAVRLAAMDAAGQLKLADCAARLFEILLTARDNLSHDHARDSLAKIAAPDIADQAAKAIKELYLLLPQARRELQAQKAEPTIQATERVYLLERNLQSCCRLLGASKSPRAVDPLLTLVNSSEKLDSPVLAAAAEALGNIGDPAAVEPLTRRLGQCLPLARQYLAARVSPNPVYVPFNEDTAGEIVTALGKLRAVGAVGNMLTLALTNTAGQRLSWAAVCAARASVTLADATNRDRIDRAVLKMLSDPAYDLTVRFVMAKAAGRLRLSAAKAALEKILNQDRPCRQVMHAAAWAIEQITGTAPSIPAPRVRQGLWIIAKPGL